jgi:TM2 domain-containing membrane protein YozV
MDEQKKRTNYCRTCGTKIPWWAKDTIPYRNGQCGACWNDSLPAAGGEAEGFTVPPDSADTQTEDESKRNCINCGTELIPNSNYCPRCGTGFEKVPYSYQLQQSRNDVLPYDRQASQPHRMLQTAIDTQQPPQANDTYQPSVHYHYQPPQQQGPAPAYLQDRKNPGVAAVLSFFWTGLGQIYNGQILKGIVLILVQAVNFLLIFVFIGLITFPLFWAIGIWDAYKTAESYNSAIYDRMGEYQQEQLPRY